MTKGSKIESSVILTKFYDWFSAEASQDGYGVSMTANKFEKFLENPNSNPILLDQIGDFIELIEAYLESPQNSALSKPQKLEISNSIIAELENINPSILSFQSLAIKNAEFLTKQDLQKYAASDGDLFDENTFPLEYTLIPPSSASKAKNNIEDLQFEEPQLYEPIHPDLFFEKYSNNNQEDLSYLFDSIRYNSLKEYITSNLSKDESLYIGTPAFDIGLIARNIYNSIFELSIYSDFHDLESSPISKISFTSKEQLAAAASIISKNLHNFSDAERTKEDAIEEAVNLIQDIEKSSQLEFEVGSKDDLTKSSIIGGFNFNIQKFVSVALERYNQFLEPEVDEKYIDRSDTFFEELKNYNLKDKLSFNAGDKKSPFSFKIHTLSPSENPAQNSVILAQYFGDEQEPRKKIIFKNHIPLTQGFTHYDFLSEKVASFLTSATEKIDEMLLLRKLGRKDFVSKTENYKIQTALNKIFKAYEKLEVEEEDLVKSLLKNKQANSSIFQNEVSPILNTIKLNKPDDATKYQEFFNHAVKKINSCTNLDINIGNEQFKFKITTELKSFKKDPDGYLLVWLKYTNSNNNEINSFSIKLPNPKSNAESESAPNIHAKFFTAAAERMDEAFKNNLSSSRIQVTMRNLFKISFLQENPEIRALNGDAKSK